MEQEAATFMQWQCIFQLQKKPKFPCHFNYWRPSLLNSHEWISRSITAQEKVYGIKQGSLTRNHNPCLLAGSTSQYVPVSNYIGSKLTWKRWKAGKKNRERKREDGGDTSGSHRRVIEALWELPRPLGLHGPPRQVLDRDKEREREREMEGGQGSEETAGRRKASMQRPWVQDKDNLPLPSFPSLPLSLSNSSRKGP